MFRLTQYLAAMGLVLIAAALPRAGLGFGTGSFDIVQALDGHPGCSFNAYHDNATQETQLNFFVPGLPLSQSAGGNYWLGGAITSWAGGDILASSVAATCGISNITNFVTDGANGTYATDDFIGVTFRGTSNADGLTYDYTIGISGATTTVFVNSRTALPNTDPTADAGPDQTVAAGATVNLDGTGSDANDPGQSLTYAWTQLSGTAVTLTGGTTATPSFTAPTPVAGGPDAVLVFSLTVNDGVSDSLADTVSITVTAPPNTAPTADAGPDQTVASAAAVTLDGTGSDANDVGQTLTYAWTQTSGPAVTLTGGTSATPGFTAPTLLPGAPDASLTFSLVVNDGVEDSAPDTVTITVTAPPNTAPTANAGPDQTVASAAAVTLDGTASDANNAGQTLSYAWTQIAGTAVTLTGGTTATPSFTAPALVPGAPDLTLTFSLTVNDGIENSPADTVTITVTAPPNTAPTANAGPDQTVAQGSAVTLDGTGSNANDVGQTLTYAWTQTAGPAVTLTGATTATPGFTAPGLNIGDADLTLSFSLTVNDGVADSAADSVTITVTAPLNTAPTADAGPDQVVASGAGVTLDGSGSDAGDAGQTLSYAWTQTGGPAVTLTGAAGANPGFTAPTLPFNAADEILTFSLTVNDGIADSAADTVTVTVTAPVDVTRPSVAITGAPGSYTAGTPFTVTVTFSEPVTGFVAGDITVANGTVTNLTGTGADYLAEITPGAAAAPIDLSIAENVALDQANNGNLASAMVSVQLNTTTIAQELIADALTARGRALINAQPNLRGFLTGSGPGARGFVADVTQGTGTFRLGAFGDSRFWVLAQGEWSETGTTEQSYANLAFGGHLYRAETLVLGAMVQVDRADTTLAGGTFEGTGWLLGPYLVARLPDQPLVFSASLLHGQSDNTLTLTGLPGDDFASTRTLLTAGVEGRYAIGDGTTLIPALDLAHVTDKQEAYIDSLANPVPAQTIRLTEASFGLGVERLVAMPGADLTLSAGISGIFSQLETPSGTTEDTRARIDLGASADLAPGSVLSVSLYYDGIGADAYEAYGAELLLQLRF